MQNRKIEHNECTRMKLYLLSISAVESTSRTCIGQKNISNFITMQNPHAISALAIDSAYTPFGNCYSRFGGFVGKKIKRNEGRLRNKPTNCLSLTTKVCRGYYRRF